MQLSLYSLIIDSAGEVACTYIHTYIHAYCILRMLHYHCIDTYHPVCRWWKISSKIPDIRYHQKIYEVTISNDETKQNKTNRKRAQGPRARIGGRIDQLRIYAGQSNSHYYHLKLTRHCIGIGNTNQCLKQVAVYTGSNSCPLTPFVFSLFSQSIFLVVIVICCFVYSI